MTALFEHSPWVEARADARPSSGDRHADLMAVVHDATPEEQLALIRAHPELAGKAAVDGTLTEASAAEQASAGLDRLTQAEFDRFHALNAAYREQIRLPLHHLRAADRQGGHPRRDGAPPRQRPRHRDRRPRSTQIGEIVRLRLEDHGMTTPLHPRPRHHARPARRRAWRWR